MTGECRGPGMQTSMANPMISLAPIQSAYIYSQNYKDICQQIALETAKEQKEAYGEMETSIL
jgi:hypothetical protein